MGVPRVTIVIVPREQFGRAPAALERVYAATSPPFELVYVDGNSPPSLRRYLAQEADRRGFTLVRTDHYLTSNEGRNLGLERVRTPYVAFLDNDVSPEPGWLDALLACAEETGAWVVGPIVHQDEGAVRLVHYGGAAMRIVEDAGVRRFSYTPQITNVPVSRAPVLERTRCDLVKFYGVLVRRDALDRVGPFDEGVRSFFEPADFALAIQAAGGEVYLEPRAVVTHTLPPPLPAADLPFFLLRWSNEWLHSTLRHFARKHGLSPDDPGLRHHWHWRSYHRRRALPPALWHLLRTPPFRYPAKAVDRLVFDGLLESTIVRPAERRRRASGAT